MQVVKKLLVLTLFVNGVAAVCVTYADTGVDTVVAQESTAQTAPPTAIKGSTTSQIVCLDQVPTGTKIKRRRCQTVAAWKVENKNVYILENIDYIESPQTFKFKQRSDEPVLLQCRQELQSYDLATTIERASVALTQSESNSNPGMRFEELVCRGSAYEGLTETSSALRDYREALRLASRNFDPFDERLVDPLARLGRLSLALGDADGAEDLLLRAQDITHRIAGIYNVQQKNVVDDLTKALVQQGRLMQADRQQELRLKSARETYGSTPELVEALHDYAKWNAAVQRFSNVRVAFEEAISILEAAYGENDLRLIKTLELRARLYSLHPLISRPKAGETAMQRIADIHAAQDPVDQLDVLKARTALGDWYLQGLRVTRALDVYTETIRTALARRIDAELINSIYGAPRLFFLDTAAQRFFSPNASDELAETGFIRVEYTVTEKGMAKEIRVLADTVDNIEIKNEIMQRVRTAVFRPRYVDGVAVATPDIEQKFVVRRSGSSLTIDTVFAPLMYAR